MSLRRTGALKKPAGGHREAPPAAGPWRSQLIPCDKTETATSPFALLAKTGVQLFNRRLRGNDSRAAATTDSTRTARSGRRETPVGRVLSPRLCRGRTTRRPTPPPTNLTHNITTSADFTGAYFSPFAAVPQSRFSPTMPGGSFHGGVSIPAIIRTQQLQICKGKSDLWHA